MIFHTHTCQPAVNGLSVEVAEDLGKDEIVAMKTIFEHTSMKTSCPKYGWRHSNARSVLASVACPASSTINMPNFEPEMAAPPQVEWVVNDTCASCTSLRVSSSEVPLAGANCMPPLVMIRHTLSQSLGCLAVRREAVSSTAPLLAAHTRTSVFSFKAIAIIEMICLARARRSDLCVKLD